VGSGSQGKAGLWAKADPATGNAFRINRFEGGIKVVLGHTAAFRVPELDVGPGGRGTGGQSEQGSVQKSPGKHVSKARGPFQRTTDAVPKGIASLADDEVDLIVVGAAELMVLLTVLPQPDCAIVAGAQHGPIVLLDQTPAECNGVDVLRVALQHVRGLAAQVMHADSVGNRPNEQRPRHKPHPNRLVSYR